MKAIIFAGGKGTRFSEKTQYLPKPMIEIGGKPILWHIMKIYAAYGIKEFVICCGYKGYVIKEYFLNYFLHNTDVSVDLSNNTVKLLENHSEDWKVTLVDTGLNTMTAGRLKRVRKYVEGEPFCLTYGDGVSDVNIKELLKYHGSKGKYLTMTAVQPSGKFGALNLSSSNDVLSFKEKPKGDGAWVNGGFFVCEPEIFDYIDGSHNKVIFEREPLEQLAEDGQLCAYKHDGFWKPMDTLKDKIDLTAMWEEERAPWAKWLNNKEVANV